MKKIILITAAACLIVIIIVAALLLKSQSLQSALSQANQMTQQMQDELKRVQAEKLKVQQDNEKLHADAVSYIALNTQLQDEKDALQKRFNEAQKSIEGKESDLQKARRQLDEMDKATGLQKSQEQDKLRSEKAGLEKKIASLEEALTKERGLFHYNLGVAYAQAKLYDEAVDAYAKSVNYLPDNADAHYNLAVLYENMKDDPERAVLHYKRYLELKPGADDVDEVESAIKKLE